MKNRLFIGLAALGLSVVMFSSCAKLPQAEVDAANAAIEVAKAAGADVYVHETFVALQDSMNVAMVMIETQKSKLFKKYTPAKEKLVQVAAFAAEVKTQSDARKEELRVEATNTIEEVKTLLATNQELVAKAPKGKEGASALNAIKDELAAIEASNTEAATLLASEQIIPALDKAKAAKEKATAINTELNEAIAKKGKR